MIDLIDRQKIGAPNNLKVTGIEYTNGTKQDAQNLSESNSQFINKRLWLDMCR